MGAYFAGPFQKMFILIVDAHSKWPEIIEMPSKTSSKTIEELRNFSLHMGYIPEQVVTDKSLQFRWTFTITEVVEFLMHLLHYPTCFHKHHTQ